MDLSSYFTQAETQTYVASELLAYYPRSELDSQLTATFTQYWTSSCRKFVNLGVLTEMKKPKEF